MDAMEINKAAKEDKEEERSSFKMGWSRLASLSRWPLNKDFKEREQEPKGVYQSEGKESQMPWGLTNLRKSRKPDVAKAQQARSVCLIHDLKDNGKKLATGEGLGKLKKIDTR